MKTVSIYMLTSPIKGDKTAYVGSSINPEQRYRNHMRAYPSTSMRVWVDALAAMGKKPILTVVDTCYPDEAEQAEEDCIAIVRATRGKDLLNSIKGHCYRRLVTLPQ